MELTTEIVFGFAGAVLSQNFDNPKPTPDFHKVLWDLCCSKEEWVSIAAPRGHAKSTAVTHCFVLANALFMRSSNIMILSDTEDQAKQFLSDIKMELEENQILREQFGINHFNKDNEKEIVVSMGEAGHQFRIFAKGAGQSLRGSKWRGRRPDLVIGDDMENDEMVISKDRRAKVKKWLLAALLPSLSDTGRIRLVGTILHADSLLEYTLNSPSWKSARFEAHNDDFTEILWPEKFSERKLRRIQREYADAGELDIYAQEYRNQPIDDSISMFRKGDFLPIDNPNEYLEYYVGVDLAVSTKQTADYTVFMVVGVNKEGTLKVVDVRRGRMDTLQSIDEVFFIQQRYKPQFFIFEDENINKAIGPFLRNEMHRRNVYPLIECVKPSKDKVTRARSIIARTRSGNIQFDTDADWFIDLYTEMKQFPRSKNDDQVDALSMIGLYLQSIFEADETTTYEEEEDEFEEEYLWETGEESGMCMSTGY